jgi:hypothetical protein
MKSYLILLIIMYTYTKNATNEGVILLKSNLTYSGLNATQNFIAGSIFLNLYSNGTPSTQPIYVNVYNSFLVSNSNFTQFMGNKGFNITDSQSPFNILNQTDNLIPNNTVENQQEPKPEATTNEPEQVPIIDNNVNKSENIENVNQENIIENAATKHIDKIESLPPEPIPETKIIEEVHTEEQKPQIPITETPQIKETVPIDESQGHSQIIEIIDTANSIKTEKPETNSQIQTLDNASSKHNDKAQLFEQGLIQTNKSNFIKAEKLLEHLACLYYDSVEYRHFIMNFEKCKELDNLYQNIRGLLFLTSEKVNYYNIIGL